jgi:hypothetical protein
MDNPLVPLSYKEEMYGSLFSRNTLRYLYHILSNEQMQGNLFLWRAFLYVHHKLERCKVTHFHGQPSDTHGTCLKDVRELIFMKIN